MKYFSLIVFCMIIITPGYTASKIAYPITHKQQVVDTYFGVEVKEPYRWLENDKSTETAEWVSAENSITQDYLSKIPFRAKLKQRLTVLNNYPKYGSPFKNNGNYYFFKNNGLQNQSVLYRQATLNSEPEVMFDPNSLSADGTVALSATEFSKDGKYMGYSISRSGSDWNEIFVMDTETRQLLPDHIQWAKFSGIAWCGNGFYYSAYSAPVAGKEYSEKNEYQKIFYHKIGDLQNQDILIYENRDFPLRNCSASVTADQKFLIITETESTSGNSLLVKDLTRPSSPIIELASGFVNDYSVVEHLDGKLYVLTNWGAPNQRLMVVDPVQAAPENWKELIPESTDVLISANVVGGLILAVYMKDACNHLYGFDLSGKKLYEVQMPTLGSVTGLSCEKDDNEAFYIFTSYTYPPTVFRLDVVKNTTDIFQETQVQFKSDQYINEQVFFVSKDGTKVPMSITYKKGMKKNGQNPLLLYGYGGFNISLNPSFNVSRIPFLENGGIYVVANIRGGGEYGEAWHLNGTKMNKQNVFDDFISAAEYLIKAAYTNPKKLAINGGSNGGLLVGACMTQRPDLFAVAVPEVGVLDMLRYHRFTIGWAWATDYGTSDESKEMFEYLKAYSPLHNIDAGRKYPATLVMTGDHDDRVVPAHSFKFAATLQAANKSKTPTLIRIDSKAGHGAGKPIGKVIDAQTDMWSFVMLNLGMKPKF